VYGKKTLIEMPNRKIRVPRQMLHAAALAITHPRTGVTLRFTSPVPDDLRQILDLLEGAAL
jgi:23S rRNA pseudouridine1911/1915/1917 synthase